MKNKTRLSGFTALAGIAVFGALALCGSLNGKSTGTNTELVVDTNELIDPGRQMICFGIGNETIDGTVKNTDQYAGSMASNTNPNDLGALTIGGNIGGEGPPGMLAIIACGPSTTAFNSGGSPTTG